MSVKHVSGKWSALQDRGLYVKMQGRVSSVSELAVALRAMADKLEGIASPEDRLDLAAENVPVSLTVEESR